jgi:multidrug efflux pump subunit AcrA (membrane-fusion protein)
LEQARKDLEKYELIAPFDGVVRQIDFKVGDNILADDAKFVYLINPYVLEVSVLLDQVEIKNVAVGQKALVVFDSFPEQTFSGQASTIYQTPQEKSGVISYEALITLDINEIIRKTKLSAKDQEANKQLLVQNNPIFSGMTASVEIITQEALDVLLIPNLAISKTEDRKTVKLMQKGTELEQEITTGMTDGIQTEVVNGLAEGDIIVRTNIGGSQNGVANEQTSNNTSSSDATRDFMRATRNGGGGVPPP